MKVAVTSQGKDLSSPIDPRFGRAKYFVIVDTDTGMAEAVDNGQNLGAAQGAGIQAAQCVARHGVEAVLTGHCGPKAFQALLAGGIVVYLGAQGTVADAFEKLRSGALKPSDSADVGGHWQGG